MRLRYLLFMCLSLTGCGHNVYVEHDTAGLYLAFPIGVEGSRASISIGSAKTVVATVRGGTGFTTETSTGGGLFSGAAGTAKVTQFKSNMQLNEGNIEKIMTSPDVPEQVKITLAEQLVKNTAAPEFLPTATATREAATTANGNTNVINKFNTTGIDKLVETVPQIVEPVVDAAESIVNGTVSNVTTIVTSTVDTTGDVVNHTMDGVVETTGNIRKTWNCIAFVSVLACVLLALLNLTKKTKKVKTVAETVASAIKPPKMEPEPGAPAGKPSDIDNAEAEAFVDDPDFHIDDTPEKDKKDENPPAKKPGFFKKVWRCIVAFFVSAFSLWGLLSEDQQEAIIDGAKRKLKK